jgi:hypothetical protein
MCQNIASFPCHSWGLAPKSLLFRYTSSRRRKTYHLPFVLLTLPHDPVPFILLGPFDFTLNNSVLQPILLQVFFRHRIFPAIFENYKKKSDVAETIIVKYFFQSLDIYLLYIILFNVSKKYNNRCVTLDSQTLVLFM